MDKNIFKQFFMEMIQNKDNPYHPLVWINGNPEIGQNVYIGGFSEINAKGARVAIGDNCDIASFTAINCADSHLKTIGLLDHNVCKNIVLEHNVFVGSHTVILGGTHVGHHSVIGAGSVVCGVSIPPYSLAVGHPLVVKAGYYLERAGHLGNYR